MDPMRLLLPIPLALALACGASSETPASSVRGSSAPASEAAADRPASCPAQAPAPDPLPHVTLARIQRKASGAQREEALRWAAALDVAGAPLRVDRLALYTWAADRKARLFRLVAERPL